MTGRPSHRDRLIAGALECIQKRGYARTTSRDIARAAGANLGSITYHFGSKDALLAVAIGDGFRRWTEELVAVLNHSGSALPDAIAAAATTMVTAFEQRRPLLVGLVESLSAAVHDDSIRAELATGYADARNAWRSLLDAASEGPVPDVDSSAALVVALLDGLVVQWLISPETFPDTDTIASAALALFQHPMTETSS